MTHSILKRHTNITPHLQEMKAGLDLEIGMFRCLVVSEEERLGLIPGVFQYQHLYIVDGVFCIVPDVFGI